MTLKFLTCIFISLCKRGRETSLLWYDLIVLFKDWVEGERDKIARALFQGKASLPVPAYPYHFTPELG